MLNTIRSPPYSIRDSGSNRPSRDEELESLRLRSDTNLRAVKPSLPLTETSTLESICGFLSYYILLLSSLN